MYDVCEWPVVYTDCGKSVAPATLTWPTGGTVTLSRVGDTVTLTARNMAPAMTGEGLPLPADFLPSSLFVFFPLPAGGGLQIGDPQGTGTVTVTPYVSQPGAGPFTFSYLAAPLADGTPGICGALADLTTAEVQQYEERAREILWEWTKRRYGVCEVTVRPCQENCGGRSDTSTFWGRGPRWDPLFPRFGMGGQTTGGWMPVLLAGEWFNIGCGCRGICRCGVDPRYALRLPGPIGEIVSVVIDGAVLPPSAYRVDGGQMLVRIDGEMWPRCQNLLANPGEPDTFTVTYKRGIPVPVGGQVAAGRLACELALMDCGSEDCMLPERLQQVVRQGISIGVQLDGETWDSSTNIWSIDSWVAAVNRPRPFASAYSVDVPARYPR